MLPQTTEHPRLLATTRHQKRQECSHLDFQASMALLNLDFGLLDSRLGREYISTASRHLLCGSFSHFTVVLGT